MRMSQLLGRRDKDAPKEAQSVSHQLLLRGGYARQVGAGLFSLLPLGYRVIKKIEAIVREEMEKVGAQEVLMPVVLPRELWEESGRYDTVGSELLRFKDRTGKDFVLGMTHEEAVVHLARNEVNSYKQFPFTVYQVQTKFRDEPRARSGLVRVKEFTMKDAYSFHMDQPCLEKTYWDFHKAYEQIFDRVGLKNVASVASDAGMMGGGLSHEFMSVLDIGEDSFLTCSSCDYRANREVAKTNYGVIGDVAGELEVFDTPGTSSIEDLCREHDFEPTSTCMAFFCLDEEEALVCALIRGDLEINEAKIKSVLGCKELVMAGEEAIRKAGFVPGYASVLRTDAGAFRLLVDESLRGRKGMVAGANEEGKHIKGFDLQRDMEGYDAEWCDLASVADGSPCVECGSPLKLQRGVEIGNIFQLGSKYSDSMKMTYLDQQGKAQTPIMGCYGIGIGRLMACVMEEQNDRFGPIWPENIAPFQIQINALDMRRGEGEVGKVAEDLYRELLDLGLEVIFDDRNEKAGFQFSDADLLGVPLRVIISPKTLKDGEVEVRTRAVKDSDRLPLEGLAGRIAERVHG